MRRFKQLSSFPLFDTALTFPKLNENIFQIVNHIIIIINGKSLQIKFFHIVYKNLRNFSKFPQSRYVSSQF